MIRDPSDGSVKATCKESLQVQPAGGHLNFEGSSGLPPTSAKAAYLERLEASRGWLKDYHAKPRPMETIEEAKS